MSNQLKIVADENITFARDAFLPHGKLLLLPGREIRNHHLKDADLLLVRSVTEVNEQLLTNTPVKFVGTATIGTDHIDINYLNNNNIYFTSAKGCNAYAVVEYLFTALLSLAFKSNVDPDNFSLGIIGAGNIGSKVAAIAAEAGITTFVNDPPQQFINNNYNYVPLQTALKADIITFHVPLTLTGPHKTFHLLNEKSISELKGTIIINTSRGAVIDNPALEAHHHSNQLKYILDVWESEPDINKTLLRHSFIGTPHIAGYSLEGKVNGTVMLYNAAAQYFGFAKNWKPLLPEVAQQTINIESPAFIQEIYNIHNDSRNLKQAAMEANNDNGKYFDQLRKNYIHRREFINYNIRISKNMIKYTNLLKALRFNLINH